MQNNKMKARLGYVAIFLSLGLAFASNGFARDSPGSSSPVTQSLSQEAPLSNVDIVKLTKLELGDQVIIAKINQAKVVNFDLGMDALIKLKKDGVSKEVISVMLKTTTPTTPQNQAASGAVSSGTSIDSSTPRAGVWLRSNAGDVELIGHRGETKVVYAFVTALRFQDYPSLSAKEKVHDLRPTILVPLQEDPKRSQAYLVKLDPDQKADKRSLKIGQGFMGAYSGLVGNGQDGGSPDSDWIIPYDASEERPGIWRMVAKTDLVPGEYGYYFRGVLYDFAVDK